MAVSISGTKTVSKDASPTVNASALTTILALAPEQMTVAQLNILHDAVSHVGNSGQNVTIGTLFP